MGKRSIINLQYTARVDIRQGYVQNYFRSLYNTYYQATLLKVVSR